MILSVKGSWLKMFLSFGEVLVGLGVTKLEGGSVKGSLLKMLLSFGGVLVGLGVTKLEGGSHWVSPVFELK